MMTERFEMRLDPQTLDRINSWRSTQPDLPSRAESIRRLINLGLGRAIMPRIELSDGEKLILAMLGDLYDHHKVDGNIDPKFVMSAITSGHCWGLDWQYSLFQEREDETETVKEVLEILEMWEFVELGFQALPKDDQRLVEQEAERSPIFRGFDGNNENKHFSIARFLIDDLERFQSFKGRDLNSHWPVINNYRRMLVQFEPMKKLLPRVKIGKSQLIELLTG